jgi:hypothetical protein
MPLMAHFLYPKSLYTAFINGNGTAHFLDSYVIQLTSEKSYMNEGISAASFCRQVVALVPDMVCNFYLVKIHKIVNNSATTEAREKISTYLESLEL